MPKYVPNFGNPNFKILYGNHAFSDLKDLKKQELLILLYRSDLKRRLDFNYFGPMDVETIRSYIPESGLYYGAKLPKDVSVKLYKSLIDLTNIDNQKIILDKLGLDLSKYEKSFRITDNSTFVNLEVKCPELQKEIDHLKSGGKLLFRTSDSAKADNEFAKKIKDLFPGKKGIYTKCLKPLIGDSLSHSEIILWNQELLNELFDGNQYNLKVKHSSADSKNNSFSDSESGSEDEKNNATPGKRKRKSSHKKGSRTSPRRASSSSSSSSSRGTPRSSKKKRTTTTTTNTKKKPKVPKFNLGSNSNNSMSMSMSNSPKKRGSSKKKTFSIPQFNLDLNESMSMSMSNSSKSKKSSPRKKKINAKKLSPQLRKQLFSKSPTKKKSSNKVVKQKSPQKKSKDRLSKQLF